MHIHIYVYVYTVIDTSGSADRTRGNVDPDAAPRGWRNTVGNLIYIYTHMYMYVCMCICIYIYM